MTSFLEHIWLLYSILQLNNIPLYALKILFLLSLVNGDRNCFLLLAIMNNAHIFVWIYIYIYLFILDYFFQSHGNFTFNFFFLSFFLFKGLPKSFPKQLNQFPFPQAVYMFFSFFPHSLILIIFWLQPFSDCEVVCHCGFDLQFLDD